MHFLRQRARKEVAEIFGPYAMNWLRCVDLHKVGGVRLEAAVMQSQHGVPSALTAAPVHGQYGYVSVLLTTTEQAVLALYLSPRPPSPPPVPSLFPSVQRSVKCHGNRKLSRLHLRLKPPRSEPADRFRPPFLICARWECIIEHAVVSIHSSACVCTAVT